jgi:hypothetical protein
MGVTGHLRSSAGSVDIPTELSSIPFIKKQIAVLGQKSSSVMKTRKEKAKLS